MSDEEGPGERIKFFYEQRFVPRRFPSRSCVCSRICAMTTMMIAKHQFDEKYQISVLLLMSLKAKCLYGLMMNRIFIVTSLYETAAGCMVTDEDI